MSKKQKARDRDRATTRPPTQPPARPQARSQAQKPARPPALAWAIALVVLFLAAYAGYRVIGGADNPADPASADQPQPGADAQAGARPQMKQWAEPPEMQIDPAKRYVATVTTTRGEFQIELFAADAPKTVNNFVFLAREGFYDGVIFHRIIEPFMIQTGDPTGTGGGGPGYRFADELPPKRPYEPGIVAMANSGADTNGSQFFICTGPNCRALDDYPYYTQFGRVIAGMDTVQAIAAVPVGPRGDEMSLPKEEVRIESVTITAE